MVFHMKTTLNIDASVMAQLKREAARQGRTISELVESALRSLFRAHKRRQSLPPLPAFKSGGHRVEIADRDALYQAMEGRQYSLPTRTCSSTLVQSLHRGVASARIGLVRDLEYSLGVSQGAFTHPRVLRQPWTADRAWRFVEALLSSHGLGVLVASERHAAVAQQYARYDFHRFSFF